jgi:2-oxoglutarate dehydrogenase E1 component
MALLSSYRRHGHLAATLDPLGTEPAGDPALDARTYGLTPSLMAAVPASVLRTNVTGNTLAEVLPKLREAYSSTIAYEVEHIANIEQREWLREYIESGKHRTPLSATQAVAVLARLTKVESMERYLRKTYIGQKTFSIEGLDVMIPMLEEIISEFADEGIGTAVLGMAHRGRLSTIAHVVNRPYEEIISEFEAADLRGEGEEDDDVTGDVKYHQGSDGTYETLSGVTINVSLANNPSHLEAVDGVVEGRTRALQTNHETPIATRDLRKAAAVLIHGDAAFSAQGVVAEVLNLQALAGYAVGGTLHLIANNQIGFTTDPSDARSTRYASDLAKGFDAPIIHVNADDVEASLSAARMAVDYRRKFGRDVIIDVIGYRRFGHNETDEPAYTQPQMYERIRNHPTVRELYAQKLIAQGLVGPDDPAAMLVTANTRIAKAHDAVKGGKRSELAGHARHAALPVDDKKVETGVPASKLVRWNTELVSVPETFRINPKLTRQLDRRKTAFGSDGEADWGLAEALAFASLLAEGRPIRLSGQDTERGTFSHRHLVLHDPQTGSEYIPLQHLADARASFELYNSPLSEYACLGFEYGYSVQLSDALVLWEAQFGDFMNGAQVIIDQFIAAGNAKWGESSRLTLLLPHGYEGAGPEHSSARIERFLQLSAEGNVHLVNCSTAAQYFHLLRAQAHSRRPMPLVVFTPKSLLRLRPSYATIGELAEGAFKEVIDDPRFAEGRERIERVLLCSGKIYYDLVQHPRYAATAKTAIVRVELLSPLPVDEIIALLASYPNLKSVVWVQEEPQNMGARAHVRRRIVKRLPHGVADVDYIDRPYRASPSEGYGGAHAVEQERILTSALTEG